MDTQMLFAARLGHDLMARQFETQERRHRAAAYAGRDRWHQRFARHFRRLRSHSGGTPPLSVVGASVLSD
jgi:hypothetical protein